MACELDWRILIGELTSASFENALPGEGVVKVNDLRSIAVDAPEGGVVAAACGCETTIPCDLRIKAASILRINGYSRVDEAPPAIRDLATLCASRVGFFFAPTVGFREVAVEGCSAETLTLEGEVILHCRDFAALAGCQTAIVFVLTLGSAVDTEVTRHMNAGEVVEALFVETAAWLAVEQATRAFVISLRASLAQRGLAPTRRLAPGYSDWSLAEQQLLLSFLGSSNRGMPVEVLASGAMMPKMSRSGLYGLMRAKA